MKQIKKSSKAVQHMHITAWHAQIGITPRGRGYSKVRIMNAWQDDIRWWLEIIRLPETVFPQQPEIIFTTNEKRLGVKTKQIISK